MRKSIPEQMDKLMYYWKVTSLLILCNKINITLPCKSVPAYSMNGYKDGVVNPDMFGDLFENRDNILDDWCPDICRCSSVNTSLGWILYTNCSHNEINYIPDGIPRNTEYLDLSNNAFQNLSDTAISYLTRLVILDLRGNPDLEKLPMFVNNPHLRRLYVDQGSTCCVYEIEHSQLSGYSVLTSNNTPAECVATVPYTECSKQLIKLPDIILYILVVLSSLIFNPWKISVTMCDRERHKDPIIYNALHFSVSSLIATIYPAVMLCYGIAYIDDYHYHMEAWLVNPLCATVGIFLLTSTLFSAFLYMIEGICIFMKLCYPDKFNHHMIRICVRITWCVAIVIGAIPFMINQHYNAVTFYGGDVNTGFKFVIFYTVIMGLAVVVNTIVAILLIKSFMHNRKKTNHEKILVALCVYIVIVIVNMSFLIMSCIGGHMGKIGREWYTRIVVLEIVTNPLIATWIEKYFFIDIASFPGLQEVTLLLKNLAGQGRKEIIPQYNRNNNVANKCVQSSL